MAKAKAIQVSDYGYCTPLYLVNLNVLHNMTYRSIDNIRPIYRHTVITSTAYILHIRTYNDFIMTIKLLYIYQVTCIVQYIYWICNFKFIYTGNIYKQTGMDIYLLN